jgi:hypothetical protein
MPLDVVDLNSGDQLSTPPLETSGQRPQKSQRAHVTVQRAKGGTYNLGPDLGDQLA